MKKILITILLLLSINYFNIKNNNHQKDKKNYVETIKEHALPFINQLENNDIILTPKEIEEHNKKILNKTKSMYNLNTIKSITKKEILDLISSYKIPTLPKYNNGIEIKEKKLKQILTNQNLDMLEEIISPKKALITSRSNLKSFPTDTLFFNTKNETNFEQLQQTELTINTPVLIIHESKDKKWELVISEIYVGWVKNSTIAYASNTDWTYFTNNKSFGVITEPIIEINNLIFDMGVKLPYLKTINDNYQLVIPSKDENDNIIKKTITFKKNQISLGYLPYTKTNVINQAFRYEGLPYSWAGMNKSVDCSSYILNIYKTFGFNFPRNTENQKDAIGKITLLTNKTNKEKLDIIADNPVSLLYQKSHVMLYLGKTNNNHYIIHASGNDLKVTVTNITETSLLLTKIDRMITI